MVEAWAQRTLIARRGVKNLFQHGVGIGVPGAADVLQRRIETFIRETVELQVQDPVLMEVDAVNMFHSLDRGKLVEMVTKEYPELLPLVRGLEVPHFISLFAGTVIEESITGVSIGSGMAALLASLAAERAIQETIRQVEGGASTGGAETFIRCAAYIDNTMFVVPARLAQRVEETLRTSARQAWGLNYESREAQPHKVLFLEGAQVSTHRMTFDDTRKHVRGWTIAATKNSSVGQTAQRRRVGLASGLKSAGVPIGDDAFLN